MSRTRTRRLVAASVAVAGMTGLAACGSGGGDGGGGGGGGGGTIELWTHAGGNEAELGVINQIVADFNASQDQYTVEVQDFPQDTYNSSVVAAAASGNLPCILDVDGPAVPNWAWAGYIQPLNVDHDWSDHLPGSLGVVADEVYSYGYFEVALTMYTRESTLQAAGVRVPTIDEPWTKEEFDDALAKIDALGQFEHALDLGTAGTGEWIPYAYSPMLQSFGGDLIDRDSFTTAEGALNGPEALEWAQWFRGLIEDGYIAQTSGEDSTLDFVNGKSGIVYSGVWAAPQVAEAFDDGIAIPPPDLGEGPKIGAGSWQWALSSDCNEEEGAREYLQFALDTKYFVQYAEALNLIPTTGAAAEQIPAYAEDGENRIFLEMADRFAVPRPETPAYQFISSVFQKATTDILAGGDPQQILDRAVSEIDADIRENGNYEF